MTGPPAATRPPSWLLFVVVLVVTGAIYLSGLDVAPAYIGGDEAVFATFSHSLATTGRDLNGTRMPLFVRVTDPLVPHDESNNWYQPFLFYVLALALKFLPVTEWAIRLPTVLMAIVDVLLVYAIGRRVFASPYYAVLAAATLALTPAHFLMSRQAADYICPLPFVLGWLWCFVTFNQTGKAALMLAGGLILGAGLFSYISSWVVMPFFLLITLAALWPSRQTFRAPGLLASGGFVIPLLLAAPWFWSHPEILQDTLTRYRLQDGPSPSLLLHASPVGAFNLGERITLYWDYFNPSFLFFAGGTNPTQATARAGVFLLAVSVFLLCGFHALWLRRSRLTLVLIAGFLAAPVPVVLTMPPNPEYSIARVLTLVPFGALIGTFGVEYLLVRHGRMVRVATLALLISMPLQFGYFVRDYFDDYQVRSAVWFDPVGFRDVVADILARDAAQRVPAVYLSDALASKSVRWKFYLLKGGRSDLWDRTKRFSAATFDPAVAVPGSLFVLYAKDGHVGSMLTSGAFSTAAVVTSESGEPSAIVLRRNP